MTKGKKPYKTLRNFFISIILLVLLAFLLPFFLKGPDKQALISLEKIKLPEIKLLKKQPRNTRQSPTSKGVNATNKKNILYKWKDKHGVIHFTDYPNPDGPCEEISAVPSQTHGQETNTSPKKILDTTKNPDADTISTLPFPISLSPSRVKKLKEDAEKIRESLQQKYDEMSQVQEK